MLIPLDRDNVTGGRQIAFPESNRVTKVFPNWTPTLNQGFHAMF